VPGSELPPPPGVPVPPVPPLPPPCGGACGVGAGAGVAGGAAPPPLPGAGAEPLPEPDEPELPPAEPLESPLRFRFFGVVSSPGTGGVCDGSNVCTGSLGFESPPLDAIATTTMRKKSPTHPSATSLRRR
jgi:hypothetical protein